ncbi:IS110 family transposase [Dactylosporangium sp. AC04546]|uniref:IS110 family transposase n=1 Tax=Dactylosporangium sp. AC04546 TaxID=2862460 RepID=UPI002E7B941E|nr:IS110 family transposase [Dactylosporangium sp. AC04546]WVK89608.1 IS110 family transposase [Dactylosporangium sp. AC04546]
MGDHDHRHEEALPGPVGCLAAPEWTAVATPRTSCSNLRRRRTADALASLDPRPSARPFGTARLPGDIGDISRFPSRGHFASWNGTAPIDASCGDQRRHRLSRAGNRRINRTLHIAATVQLRHDTCQTSSTNRWAKTPRRQRRAREDKRERLCNPARPTQSQQPALRNSHFPDPPPTTLERPSSPPLDTEECLGGVGRAKADGNVHQA